MPSTAQRCCRWLIGCWLVLAGASLTYAARPNFVILMTDDQRYDALSAAGNTILKTPNIDRLAAEGVHFRNAFVTNALCAPSRASLLTGTYSHTHGVIDNNQRRIDPALPFLPDLLRQAGYRVAFCGKSHVAGALRDRKWDYYFGFKGQGDYLRPMLAEGVDGKDKLYDGYMDDVVTDKAVTWLKQQGAEPFCLFLWFKAPHRSWQRARRHHDLFRDVVIPKPQTYDDDLRGYPGKPRAFALADNKIGDFADVRTVEGMVKDYYATVVAVDENVGKVLNTLDAMGRAGDTLVMYTSDNGFFHGEWRLFDKRLMHEPSIRVPLLMRLPKLARTAVRDEMALNIDIAPTLLDLAEIEIPVGMQGRSLKPLLSGGAAPWRKDWLYEYFEFPGVHSVRKHRGVRTETHKLIHYYEAPEEFELYDLARDPQERDNLHGRAEYRELENQLLRRIEELRRETDDPDLARQ
ncbi:MAG: sulfatase [Pirellulales bacterium]|nr:sulfatase [Pirellulales bacterium]